MNQTRVFSQADAMRLREGALDFDAARNSPDISLTDQDASPELQRYFRHYGFTVLFERESLISYSLTFADHDYRIARHLWQVSNARGTVLVVHGLFDHTGLYLKLIDRLLSEGFNVVSFDLPGHGLSSGERVAIKDFSEYKQVFNDCLTWCQESLAGPYFAVGQSTGCSAILYSLLSDTTPLTKVVLLAPLIRPRAWLYVSWSHRLVGRFIARVPRHFGVNSHDPEFLHFLSTHDPLQTRYIAMSWVKAMRNWVSIFKKMPAATHANVLIIQGTADLTVDWRWNVPLIQRKFPRAELQHIPGAFHHLVNEAEPWRGQVFDATCQHLLHSTD